MGDDFTPDDFSRPEDLEDPIPVLLAQIDQALAIAPELARMAHGFYQAFIDAGFEDKQALYLTASQLHSTPGTAP